MPGLQLLVILCFTAAIVTRHGRILWSVRSAEKIETTCAPSFFPFFFLINATAWKVTPVYTSVGYILHILCFFFLVSLERHRWAPSQRSVLCWSGGRVFLHV